MVEFVLKVLEMSENLTALKIILEIDVKMLFVWLKCVIVMELA